MHMSQTMNIMVYEIFDHVNTLAKTDRQAAIEFLQNNRSRVVVEGYLKMNYDPAVEFQLPIGPAPYKKKDDVPDGYCMTDLKQEFRRMRVFTDPDLNLTRVRREQLWLQLCEGLFWKEADMMNKIKDRRLSDMYPELTYSLVKEAFPTSIPDEPAAPVPEEALTPIDYGDDPSKISEEELIAQSVAAFLAEEAKNSQADAVKMGDASAQTPQRKKPGPKPKVKQPVEELPKQRKKPGPKPKNLQPPLVESQPVQRKKPGPKPKNLQG